MNQEPYFKSCTISLTSSDVFTFEVEMKIIERAQRAISAVSDIGAFLERNKKNDLLNDIENNHLTVRGLHDAMHTAALAIMFSHETVVTMFERAFEKAEKEGLS